MENTIRRLCIGAEVKERFVYSIDSAKPIHTEMVNGKPIGYFVCNIIEDEDHYKIYVKKAGEIQFWKKEMKNSFCHPEYLLD